MVILTSMEAQALINNLVDHFLGEDWCITNPISNEQANVVILEEIKRKYPAGKIRQIPKKRRNFNVRKS